MAYNRTLQIKKGSKKGNHKKLSPPLLVDVECGHSVTPLGIGATKKKQKKYDCTQG